MLIEIMTGIWVWPKNVICVAAEKTGDEWGETKEDWPFCCAVRRTGGGMSAQFFKTMAEAVVAAERIAVIINSAGERT